MKFFSFILIVFPLYIQSQIFLIADTASWKYLDNGTNQDTAWKSNSFDDSSWNIGVAELGYGNGDEATIVGYGPSSSNKYITTYFRKKFNVTDTSIIKTLALEILRDDGAIVYINGIEVARANMPSTAINHLTPASSVANSTDGSTFHLFLLNPHFLVNGNNTIVVEIHQVSATSSDISFNLRLTGNPIISPSVIRGAYLQILTPTGVIVKWRTNIASDSKVNIGLNLSLLNSSFLDTATTTEHEVVISGLQPNTKYYYNFGSSSSILGGTSNNFFVTSPLVGSKTPMRFWVIGDAGTGTAEQKKVRDAYYSYNGQSHADGWIWLGDNAYDNGLDNEFQNNVFKNMYEPTFENTVAWPAIGNHDYANNNSPINKSVPYFSIFSLPKNGEAGGIASGTESYYSYNYANAHFVVMDSYGESRDSTGAMANWLKQDLSANNQDWTVAYWHHSPYTKGTHNSDSSSVLIEMRKNIVPILEQYGVDLVLSGHSHSYERSMLIDSHYGISTSLKSSMIIDSSSGSYPIFCPYLKNTTITRSHKGTIYAVVGCSGKLGGTASGWPHPAMYKSTNTIMGSLSLEIEDNKLEGKFVAIDGTVSDMFTIMKNVGRSTTYSICEGDSVLLQASWKGKYKWSHSNDSAQYAWVKPTATTSIFATDINECIKDTFNISVIPIGTSICNPTSVLRNEKCIQTQSIQPNPSIESMSITIISSCNQPANLFISNVYGQVLTSLYNRDLTQGKNTIQLTELNLAAGVYFLTTQVDSQLLITKFLIK